MFSKIRMMDRLRFSQCFISLTFISLLLAGCSENATPTSPTSTVVPATPVLVVPSATPEIPAESGAPGLGDSLYPNFGNGGYDVQHYTLDLTIKDVVTSDLNGITTIDARATQNLSSFNLDFTGFQITGITVNDQPADFRRSQQELTIKPSTPLVEDQSFTVEVEYEGSPEKMDSAALPMQTGWINFDGGSFVLSEPDGAASFFPVNDHPLDKASYTFRVTVPEPFEVAANGLLMETVDQGSVTTFVFEARDPMASYLVTIDIDEFDVETSQAENGIPIRNYYPTGLPKDIRKLFQNQGEMIVYFSDIFGTYPFEVYGALVLDTRLDVALENQTMSVFSKAMADTNNLAASEQVVAHELAHQWFGDSVSLADWRDIWLNESFATYAEGLWIEHTKGRAALDGWVKKLYAFAVKHRGDMSPPGEPPAADLFNPGVYDWGALALHALRLEVGDETFFKILKTYYERFKGGNARTADFISVAEEVSGKELSPFFERWLYNGELPSIPALGLEAK